MTTQTTKATMTIEPDAEIGALSYEQARDELVSIVARLETGQVPLEESMALWQRGEALAAHCTRYLDGAQAQLAQTAETPDSPPEVPAAAVAVATADSDSDSDSDGP